MLIDLADTEGYLEWSFFWISFDATGTEVVFDLNDTTGIQLDDGTNVDWTSTTSFASIGFFEDALTDFDISVDGFRQYNGLLTAAELGASAYCSDAEITAGIYYG